jgi:hypothetical protein
MRSNLTWISTLVLESKLPGFGMGSQLTAHFELIRAMESKVFATLHGTPWRTVPGSVRRHDLLHRTGPKGAVPGSKSSAGEHPVGPTWAPGKILHPKFNNSLADPFNLSICHSIQSSL